MPDPSTLKVGDRIRILSVPTADAVDAAAKMRRADPFAQWTMRILQRLADRKDIVRIDTIDEYGQPWFSYHFRNKRGAWEYHSLAIMEPDSWELIPAS